MSCHRFSLNRSCACLCRKIYARAGLRRVRCGSLLVHQNLLISFNTFMRPGTMTLRGKYRLWAPLFHARCVLTGRNGMTLSSHRSHRVDPNIGHGSRKWGIDAGKVGRSALVNLSLGSLTECSLVMAVPCTLATIRYRSHRGREFTPRQVVV